MKDSLPQPPVRPTKGVGPQIKVGESEDTPPPTRTAAAESIAALAANPPPPAAPVEEYSDPFGNAIPKPNREEALASALMALIRKMEAVSTHPEMKATFKLGKDQRVWTGAAGHWGDEMKKAKEVLGI